MIKLNMGNILAFEFLYRAVMLPVILWGANRAAGAALRLSGYSYVTVGNLKGFLLHPGTILVLVLALAAVMVLTAFEVSCLLEAFQASAYYRRVSVPQIVLGGFMQLAREIRAKNVGLLAVIFIHSIFINGFMILQMFRQVKTLSFVLDGIQSEPAAQFALAALLLFMAAAAVPSVFLVFGCMAEQKGFKDGMRRSVELCMRRPGRTAAMLVSVNVLAALLSLAFYFILVVIAAGFSVIFVDRGLELVLLLKLKRNLVFAACEVGSIMGMAANYGALTVLYRRRSSARRREAAWEFNYPTGRLLRKKYLLGAMAAVTVLSMALALDAFRNGLALDDGAWSDIRVTAHRGSSKDAPENTMAAIALAVDQMADSVEVDVQETKDGVLVLFHDSGLKRITGRGGRLRDLSYAQAEAEDVGSWFSGEFSGEKIPTLSEALEFCKGRIFMNIELKNMGSASDLPERAAAMIAEHDMTEQCVVTSTSLKYLERVKAANPDIRTGYILSAAYGGYYKEDYVDFVSMLSTSLSQGLVNRIHEEGKAVHAWTVNSKVELRRMRRLAVDNVITDYPVYAREVLSETEEGTEFFEKMILMFR